MTLTTYTPKVASEADFVAFWEQQYNYPLEHLYTNNIGQAPTADRVHHLFIWKNGSRLSDLKHSSVEANYIARIQELNALPQNTDAAAFLAQFALGGAIWRIFWLHCWQPDRFPIYDQHVHRAMIFIEQQRLEEIPKADTAKVQQYLQRYLPFYQRFKGLNQRSVDKALWFYGKFLKETRFPLCACAVRPIVATDGSQKSHSGNSRFDQQYNSTFRKDSMTYDQLLAELKECRNFKTLGRQSNFNTYNQDGALLITNSSGIPHTISRRVYDSVRDRYDALNIDQKHVSKNYTDPVWKQCPDRIYAPYLPAIWKYI